MENNNKNKKNITKHTHHNRSRQTKVNNFTYDNQFTTFYNNPAQYRQKTIKQCNITPKENRWKYMNMNPLHATIKLHKQNISIRPIINWKNAPEYELAKHLTKILYSSLHLPHAYNTDNSILI
jgi:hypothetical protein